MNKLYLGLLGSIALLVSLNTFADGTFKVESDEGPAPVSDPANASAGVPKGTSESGDAAAEGEDQEPEDKKIAARKRNAMGAFTFGPSANSTNSGDAQGMGGQVGIGGFIYGGSYRLTLGLDGSMPGKKGDDGKAIPATGFSADVVVERGGYGICGSGEYIPGSEHFCIHVGADGQLRGDAGTDTGKVGAAGYGSVLVRFSNIYNEKGEKVWEFKAGPSFGAGVMHSGSILNTGDGSVTTAGISPFTGGMATFESPWLSGLLTGNYTLDTISDNNVAGSARAHVIAYFNPLKMSDGVELGLYTEGQVDAVVQTKEVDGADVSSKPRTDIRGSAGVALTFGNSNVKKISAEELESASNGRGVPSF